MKLSGLAALLILSLPAAPFAQNLIVNGSFEDPITFDGPPFVGLWEGFNGGAGATAANSGAMPRTGLQSLELSIVNTDNTFAGAFQDVAGLAPGDEYVFGGWLASPSSPLDLTVEFRIEWRNTGSNTEISRTANETPVPSAAFSPFSLTATVPDGADSARLVYAIQTFTPEPSNTGLVYVDDVSFALVPEPSSIALGILGLGLVAMRRRMSA